MKNYQWQLENRKSVSLGRFTINLDNIKLDENNRTKYSYVEIKEGVCILPVLDNKVLVLHQYRYPLAKWVYELPAGLINEGEEPLQTAARELCEETGYKSSNITSLGYFYPSAGSTDEKVHLFLARNLRRCRQNMDNAEEIEVKEFTVEEIKTMIAQNKFNHGSGIAAFSKYIFGKS